MSSAEERPALVTEILTGDSRELQLLAAQGMVPLAPHHLVSIQVALTSVEDEEISTSAERSLNELDPRIAAALLGEEDDPEVVAYLALHHRHPVVLEAVLRRRGVARPLLVELGRAIDPELQEILLLRQDAILEEPAILDALESNPQASAYTRRRVHEYREHLLPRERTPKEQVAALEWRADELSDDEVAAALEDAAGVPAKGELDDTTGLSEAQVRHLPVPVRLRLTRGAARSLRAILVRDPNPTVATSVLLYNAISDGEAEQIAASRSVRSEVLEMLGNDRKLARKYAITLALVRNPRSPLGMAIRMTPRLGNRDLQSLSRDRNVASAVRANAGRLYRIKNR